MSEVAPITLVAPDGQRFDVPDGGVAQLKAKGFRDLNEDEKKDLELQKKYGEGVVPAVGAGVSGAASGLTFGLSDVALAKTPFAEANREVAERNPGAHTAGQALALAVPIAGEFAGASVAAKAAKVASAGLTGVGKAASVVGQGARGAAEAAGLGGVAPIVGGATTAAVEGAAFQVGSNVGAAARRDVPLDAETLLAHVGEAAVLGGGIGAAVPVAGKVVRWSADKAVSGLERGMQGLREIGFGVADAAVEAGAGLATRNADRIGAAVEGVANKVTQAADESLLPRIREGLTKQTGRPDVINEVFAAGSEGQALRHELGSQTITGTREVEAQKLGKSLNEIWSQSLDNGPMFDDLALAAKKDLQASELAGLGIKKEAQQQVVRNIAEEARTSLDKIGKYNGTAKTYFEDAVNDFAARALKNPTAESLYVGLNGLKTATDKIAKFAQGAQLGDTGAAFAAEEARRFRTFAKNMLEDTSVWGAAGQVQQEVNAAYSRYQRAFEKFESQFAAKAAKGERPRVLDGAKIKKWAKDITGQSGDVKNAIIDDLVDAQSDLVALTDKLSKRSQQQAREALGSTPATPGNPTTSSLPPDTGDILGRASGAAQNLAGTKSAATQAIDRAEVLQQTQNAILSRQGAGVNPLPVALAQKIGGGALVGGLVGGLPGAVVGGSITSALEKYGAITSNPKSAIEFLNTIDRLRGIDKQRVASWIKATLSEESVKPVREALASASKTTARKILEARGATERGVESLASRLDTATPGLMRRILPAVSYADVTNSTPDEWWKRTQKTITGAQANPKALTEKLAQDVAGISDTLPDLAEAVSNQQMTVLGYLADHMPRNPRPYMLGGSAWTPDPTEMKAFRDVVLVATKPDALLPLITIGTASRAQVDAVRELWPKKFEETKQQVVNAVMTAAADGKPVSYEARIRLGQLLGVPLDPSQEPGFSQWLDSAQGAQPPQPEQQQSNMPQGINLNINTKNQLPSSLQRAAGQ